MGGNLLQALDLVQSAAAVFWEVYADFSEYNTVEIQSCEPETYRANDNGLSHDQIPLSIISPLFAATCKVSMIMTCCKPPLRTGILSTSV